MGFKSEKFREIIVQAKRAVHMGWEWLEEKIELRKKGGQICNKPDKKEDVKVVKFVITSSIAT